MTFLQTILDSEEGAKKSVTDAELAGEKKVAEFQATSQKELNDLEVELQEERAKKVDAQKEELKGLYTSTLKKGEEERENLKKHALPKEAEAIAAVLDSIS